MRFMSVARSSIAFWSGFTLACSVIVFAACEMTAPLVRQRTTGTMDVIVEPVTVSGIPVTEEFRAQGTGSVTVQSVEPFVTVDGDVRVETPRGTPPGGALLRPRGSSASAVASRPSVSATTYREGIDMGPTARVGDTYRMENGRWVLVSRGGVAATAPVPFAATYGVYGSYVPNQHTRLGVMSYGMSYRSPYPVALGQAAPAPMMLATNHCAAPQMVEASPCAPQFAAPMASPCHPAAALGAASDDCRPVYASPCGERRANASYRSTSYRAFQPVTLTYTAGPCAGYEAYTLGSAPTNSFNYGVATADRAVGTVMMIPAKIIDCAFGALRCLFGIP